MAAALGSGRLTNGSRREGSISKFSPFALQRCPRDNGGCVAQVKSARELLAISTSNVH